MPTFLQRNLYAPVLALSLVLIANQAALAADDAAVSQEDLTPIDKIAPQGEGGDSVPGTDPIYDKGITVTEIEIQGAKLVPPDVILKALDTKPGSLYSKRRLQSDLKKIYDLGYFTEKLRVVPIATRDGVHIRYEVEENPTVNGFIFKDLSVVKESELKPLFKEQIGMPQNVNSINKGVQAIEQLYKDKGYILARVDDISEDPPGTVILKINEGVVHKISFSGNKKTRDYVVRRAMAQKEGEVFNEKTVAEDMKRIFSTQTFSDVRRSVTASPSTPGEYDLTIELDEKRTGAISLGGGVDTGTGVFGSIGYSDPNFLGRGENFSSVFSVGSGVLTSDAATLKRRVLQFQTSWFNPSIRETNNSLGVSFFARELASFNVPLAIERRVGGSVDWSKPLEDYPGASISLGLGVENIKMKEGVSAARLAKEGVSAAHRQEQLDDGSFVYLTPGINFDSRNNRFDPSSGWLNSFSSKLAFGLDSDSYATVSANIRRYLKVTDTSTFALNLQGGATPVGDIPDFNAFLLGGPYTIRGFQQGGVGVGNQYVLASAELRSKVGFLKRFKRFPVYDMTQVALFADAGKLFDEALSNEDFGRPGYGFSVGAGLRVNLPTMGPIRIDWAKALGDTGGFSRSINFGVGQKF